MRYETLLHPVVALVERVSVFKSTAFLLVALWMGGDGHDYYVFNNPKFENKQQCVLYVMQYLPELNDHVSMQFKSKPTNNKFWCVDADVLREQFEKAEQV